MQEEYGQERIADIVRACWGSPPAELVAACMEDLARFTEVHGPSGYRFLRNLGERCVCLDVSVSGRFPCRIYQERPDDCRIVRPAGPACLEAPDGLDDIVHSFWPSTEIPLDTEEGKFIGDDTDRPPPSVLP